MPEEKEKKQIKDFKIVLKDFEPMVKNPDFLYTGRPIQNFSLRPREAWANWLLCAVLRKLHGDRITFAEDEQGDGIIIDKDSKQWIQTEHISALEIPKGKIWPKGEARIIEAINQKIAKGIEYTRGKTLIVFFDGAGKFYRNKVRDAIRGKHNFRRIYGIGLLSSDEHGYVYAVTEFFDNFSITFKVKINSDFTDWEVEQIKY
jgi:hypothetical protein